MYEQTGKSRKLSEFRIFFNNGAILRKKHKNIAASLLFSVLFVSGVSIAYAFLAQANDSDLETVNGTNIIRSKTTTNLSDFKSIPEALDAIVTPIIEPSVFEDCMQHPEKYDIYDGKKTVETAPCFSNACWTERITLHGVSMQPTIIDGDKIYIRHDALYNLSIGKIVAYDSLGQVSGIYSNNVIHRIVGIEPRSGAKIERFDNQYRIVLQNFNGVTTYGTFGEGRFLTNISEMLYVVKGDNNNKGCELVPENSVHGVVVGI